jgi:hypothetical protein
MSNQVRTLPTPLGLSDFEVGVTLGTGSFGRVRFATHKVSGYSDELLVNEQEFRMDKLAFDFMHIGGYFKLFSVHFTHLPSFIGNQFDLGNKDVEKSRSYTFTTSEILFLNHQSTKITYVIHLQFTIGRTHDLRKEYFVSVRSSIYCPSIRYFSRFVILISFSLY